MSIIIKTSFGLFALLIATASYADEVKHFSSQAAALEALTAPDPKAKDLDDVVEVSPDTPTTNTVQYNVPVAGETGQL
jgi:hypothetical protein